MCHTNCWEHSCCCLCPWHGVVGKKCCNLYELLKAHWGTWRISIFPFYLDLAAKLKSSRHAVPISTDFIFSSSTLSPYFLFHCTHFFAIDTRLLLFSLSLFVGIAYIYFLHCLLFIVWALLSIISSLSLKSM